MKFLKNYSLSIVLIILFLLSWGGQLFFQWKEFVQNQKEHNQEVEISGFINEFGASTMENWQSEFLQLFTMVVLTSFLIHKGSTESKDSEEEMMMRIKRIEKAVGRK